MPLQFVTRLITGGFAGAALAHGAGAIPWRWLGAGVIGAVLGTLGGYRVRASGCGRQRGHDLPVALARGRHRDSGRLRDRCAASVIVTCDARDRTLRRDHRRCRPGRPAAGRPADGGRADRRGRSNASWSAAPASTTGCIPTKTLVASAHAAHIARRGAEYGIGTGAVTRRHGEGQGPQRRHHDATTATVVEGWLEGMDGCTLIRGHARFTGSAHAAGR